MGVRAFDDALVEDTRRRLQELSIDARPMWGRMTPPQMFAHMVTAIRYSLLMEKETPNEGGFFGAYIAAPLIINGLLKIPPGQKGPAMYDTAAPSATQGELLDMFVAFRAQATHADFMPPPHPYFGNIGARGWAKLHIVHMEHHLRQFGVDTRGYISG